MGDMKTKSPAEPSGPSSPLDALPAAPPPPPWWPEVKQQAEAELERILKDTPLRAEPVVFEDGRLAIHVWDKVRGNARGYYHVAPFFRGGGEPGALPSAFRGWLRLWLYGDPVKDVKPAIEFDGQPPPGPPPVIAAYVVLRHPHGWQVRTYDLTPEALAQLAGYETGRSGEMHRADCGDLIANDIGRLPNDAIKVPL